MTVPARIPLRIYQGQTFQFEVSFLGPDDETEDFTGFTARGEVRRTVPDEEVLLSFSTQAGSVLELDDTGVVRLELPALETAALDTGNVHQSWWYDLEIVRGDGFVRRLMEGPVIVFPETTR